MSSDPVYTPPHKPLLLEVVPERIQEEKTAKSYTHWLSCHDHFHGTM